MRLEILELIVSVAKSGSISAAAREGHIQQTTLSAAIRSMETELNIRIFERQYNGVALTKDGQKLMKLAEPMLELYHQMEMLSQPKHSTLTIHVNRLLYCYFCYDVLPQLHMHFPDISMSVSMSTENPLKDPQAQGPFDIGIGCCLPEKLDVRTREAEDLDLKLLPLFTSEFMIYIHRDDPLSAKQYIDDLSCMKDRRLILANSFYTERFYISGLDKIVKSYSIMDPFDPMQLINAVTHGGALAYAVDQQLIPAQFHPLMKDIVSLHIHEPEDGQRHLRHTVHYITCHKQRYQSEQEQAVVAFLSKLLKQTA